MRSFCRTTLATRSGMAVDLAGEAHAFVAGKAAAAAELERHHEQHGHLAGEGLGGGHRDLRAGVQIDAAAGLAGDGGADDVAQAHHEGAFLVGLAHGGQGVGGFAGLGDGDDQVAAAEDRVAVAELGGLLDFGVDVGQVLEGVFADQAGVQRGAAADEDHAAEFREIARRGAHAGEHRGAEVEIEAAADGVGAASRVARGFP